MKRPALTFRTMMAVWLAAILFATGSIWALLASEALRLKPEAYAAFIGSSLFMYAMPSASAASQYFSDAGPTDYVVSVSRPFRSEAEAVRLLGRAVDEGVRRIYVEATPFIIDLFREGSEGSQIKIPHVLSIKLRNALRIASGRDPSNLAAVFNGNLDPIRSYWFPHLHSPRQPEDLSAILERARRRQVDIIFVLMPRSEAASRYLGSDFDRQLAAQASEFAGRFGVRIWSPAADWPNEFFTDHAHVNLAGRERFRTVFRESGARAR